MKPSSTQALCFPGEQEREIWLCDAQGVWKRETSASGGILALETLLFDSSPFWSLGQEEAADDAVALRWEAFGLEREGEARLWTHWRVAKREKQALIGTLALTADSNLVEPSGFRSASFEASARMLPLPVNGMAVWLELGRPVVAFTRGAELLHVAVLTSRELDADAAFEVRDTFAALQAHGFIDELDSIRVWTHCETDFVPQLACLFDGASVIKESRPDPRLPAVPSGLLPAQVAVMRQNRRLRQQRLMMVAAAAVVYCCFFGAWWLRLQWRESHANHAEIELAAAQPEMDLVREAQTRWLDLEAAIDPDLYPVELFHQIVSLLPPEGIRLKEFQMDGSKLVVSGEATTVNQALGFKDRLAACEPLKRYAWNFPVPSIREDNRAEFRAEGKLNGEAAHEGQ